MPGRDGTGPMGFGPMSGWGRGFCRGRGFGRFAPTKEQEKEFLEQELAAIKKRLKELE